ncbi:MAG: class I SAM-dependent methyltransferase [Candidatus Falkowbacteria bacterium]
MTKWKKKRWIKSYKAKNMPHWATSMTPSKLTTKFLAVLTKGKLRDEKVLEIGCGNGRDSIYLARKGLNVVGIDISGQAIKFARQNKKEIFAKKAPRGKVVFKKADVEELPFENETFGSVYSVGVLHCVKLLKSFREIRRVLKPGGKGVILVWQRTEFLKINKTQEQCDPAKLKQILKKLRFVIKTFSKNVAAKGIDYDVGHKNPHKHFAIVFVIKKCAD